MASLISRMFDSRSKDEKERDYELYSQRIFPFGEAQKEKIGDLLVALNPKEKRHYLMLHYILLKDSVTGPESKGYAEESRKLEKKKLVKITPEFRQQVKILMELDQKVDETLQYPTAEELSVLVDQALAEEAGK